jgi:DNA-binding MarR family transcriptional regulator
LFLEIFFVSRVGVKTLPQRKWWHVALGHTAKVLQILLKAEREGRELSLTDLVYETRISTSTMYTTVKESLIEGGLIEVVPKTGEVKGVYVKLTEKGRKLAQCLEQADLKID